MKKRLNLLLIVIWFCSTMAMAQTATIDGIVYEFDATEKTAMVAINEDGKYTGDIVIPEAVEYNGEVYSVTAIGREALAYCRDITSISIPKTITEIGRYAFLESRGITSIVVDSENPKYDSRNDCNAIIETATNALILGCKNTVILDGIVTIEEVAFYGCEGLTSLVISNSVTTIKNNAFFECLGLETLNIPSSVIEIGEIAFSHCRALSSIVVDSENPKYDSRNDCNAIIETATNTLVLGCKNTEILNSITTIGHSAFYGCYELTNVDIPISVTEIEDYAFRSCRGLTNVVIPNNVTTIGLGLFTDCKKLTNVTFPNTITTISPFMFHYCTALESITLPNNITTISYDAFWLCDNLKTVVLGENVEYIAENAFAGCRSLTDIYCYATSVPGTSSTVFANTDIASSVLHVPGSVIDIYKSTEPWSGFGTIKAIDGDTPGPQIPISKCATPVITYSDGKLGITCDTEGALFVTTITDSDIRTHYDSEIELTVTYNITTYAVLTGYANSDTIQASLCWIDSDPTMEQINTDISEIESTPVLVRSSNGNIFVNGATEGTIIRVYSVEGMSVGSAISTQGETTVPTTLQAGKIAIVAIGNSRIKMVMR